MLMIESTFLVSLFAFHAGPLTGRPVQYSGISLTSYLPGYATRSVNHGQHSLDEVTWLTN